MSRSLFRPSTLSINDTKELNARRHLVPTSSLETLEPPNPNTKADLFFFAIEA